MNFNAEPIVFYTREGHGQAGAEIRSFALCRALREKGVSAFVLSLRMFHADTPESKLSWWCKIKLNIQAFWRLFALRPKILVLQRVHFHLPAAFFYVFLFRPKLILDVDDWEFRENLKHFLGFSSSLSENLLRLFSRLAQTTVVGSTFLQKHLKPYARKIEIIPTGEMISREGEAGKIRGGVGKPFVNKSFPKPFQKTLTGEISLFPKLPVTASDQKTLRCVWVGSLDLRPETLEEILNLTLEFSRQVNPKLDLWLVARGEKLPVLEEHLQRLNCSTIRLFPSCSRTETLEIICQCSVGLLPLFSDTRFNHAKSPVKLFEYLASGLIPVCANRGEASEIIKHNENGFLVNNTTEMIQTLNHLLILTPEEISKLQENVKKSAAPYSLEKIVESWKSLLVQAQV